MLRPLARASGTIKKRSPLAQVHLPRSLLLQLSLSPLFGLHHVTSGDAARIHRQLILIVKPAATTVAAAAAAVAAAAVAAAVVAAAAAAAVVEEVVVVVVSSFSFFSFC